MNTLTVAKRTARWAAFLGLACGVLYSVGGLIYDLLTVGLNWGTAMAFGAVVGMPLIFGAFGFILGGLAANIHVGLGSVRRRFRGLER